MEMNPQDIIQLVFFSAVFLMVISVPKILQSIAWLGISARLYSTRGKRRDEALMDYIGEVGLEFTDKNANKNLVQLLQRQ